MVKLMLMKNEVETKINQVIKKVTNKKDVGAISAPVLEMIGLAIAVGLCIIFRSAIVEIWTDIKTHVTTAIAGWWS